MAEKCFRRQRSLHREDIWALIYDFDFLLWALHVFHTSVFFLTCCAMAYIYGLRLSPALDASGLTHPSDKFWRSSGSWLLGLKGSMPAVDLLLLQELKRECLIVLALLFEVHFDAYTCGCGGALFPPLLRDCALGYSLGAGGGLPRTPQSTLPICKSY